MVMHFIKAGTAMMPESATGLGPVTISRPKSGRGAQSWEDVERMSSTTEMSARKMLRKVLKETAVLGRATRPSSANRWSNSASRASTQSGTISTDHMLLSSYLGVGNRSHSAKIACTVAMLGFAVITLYIYMTVHTLCLRTQGWDR